MVYEGSYTLWVRADLEDIFSNLDSCNPGCALVALGVAKRIDGHFLISAQGFNVAP